tara:strand:- start:2055 stop:2975 length:921 start_codon:yes stop_codon:yes gene_type:complete
MQTFKEAPEISLPTIASSSILVELSMGYWSGRIKDKKASAAVTEDNNADVGTATVTKKLLAHCEELEAIGRFASRARKVHSEMTMPWSDLGQRLLATAMYDKYHHTMTELQAEFYTFRDDFLGVYNWRMAEVQARLGGLYVESDYPTVESLTNRFRFSINYLMINPESNDHRIELGEEALGIVRDSNRTYYQRQFEGAMNDVWVRTHKALKRMSEKLTVNGVGVTHNSHGAPLFRDSLVDNLIEMVDMLELCNVSGDSQMANMRLQLDEALRGVTADGLRTSANLRAETKTAVDEALASLPTLDLF